MMPRTIFALMVGTALLAPAAAYAGLESEAVTRYDPMPVQIVQTPRETPWYGLPNVNEFEPSPSNQGAMSVTRYPAEAVQDRDD